jgi:hypothetical protein
MSSIESIREEITLKEIEKNKRFASCLELRKSITEKLKPFMKEKMQVLVDFNIKKDPIRTKNLGSERLGEMKVKLLNLVDDIDNTVETILSKDEYWLYVDYETKVSENDYLDPIGYGLRAEDAIFAGINNVLGYVGNLLYEYEYIKNNEIFYKRKHSGWQISENYEIRDDDILSIPWEIEGKLNEYTASVFNLYLAIRLSLDLRRELSVEEAKNLWEQA